MLKIKKNKEPPRPGAPILKALAAQGLAWVVMFRGVKMFASALGLDIPMAVLLVGQGGFAALFGHIFGLRRWWLPIQLLFPPVTALALYWRLPDWVFLAAFVLLLGTYWNSVRGGVPLYLSNSKTKEDLAGLLPEKEGFRFADLGCGLGGPVLELSRLCPKGRYTGYETAPLIFTAAWFRHRLFGADNVEIRYIDFWTVDLADFDVVYCFLSPAPMPELFDKAQREMRPGSLLISNSFEVPDHPADEIMTVDDHRQTKLHLWRMGEGG